MLKLMFITNNPDIAQIADKNGVNWIFVDLETIGKDERQGKLDTVISNHCIEDISKIKKVLSKSKLLVRVNPIHDASDIEIDRVIKEGADIIMLPFFKTKEEVASFIEFVDNRAKTCLLLETPEAVEKFNTILLQKGIDFVHIGLNDLHLGYKMKFMFELLADGTVEMLCNKIKAKNIPYGFGGVGKIGTGTLPADLILAEHYRLGSNMVILSRTFFQAEKISNVASMGDIFQREISKIRKYEKELQSKPSSFFENNKIRVISEVDKIVKPNDGIST
jgi:2-keto-3-deoxy-L-rhamnonate aldolase RhmA